MTYPDQCELRDRQPCGLLAGKRCRYFEGSVLPIATRGLRRSCEKPIDDARVAEAYRDEHPALRGTAVVPEPDDDGQVRTCPDCGTWLPPRKRVCAKCAAKRRRVAYRQAKRKSRDAVHSLGQKNSKNPNVLGQKSGEIEELAPGHQNPEIGDLTVDSTHAHRRLNRCQ